MRVVSKEDMYRKDDFEGWADEYSVELPEKAKWILSGDWSVPIDILIKESIDGGYRVWLLTDCLYDRANDNWYWQGKLLDPSMIFKWRCSEERIL